MFDINKIEWLEHPLPKPGEEEHLNCFQRTILPYRDVLGLSETQIKQMGRYFGGGMRAQGTCGPVNAGLILLGILEAERDQEACEEGKKFLEAFAEENGSWYCSDLRDEAHERCNHAIAFVQKYIDQHRN